MVVFFLQFLHQLHQVIYCSLFLITPKYGQHMFDNIIPKHYYNHTYLPIHIWIYRCIYVSYQIIISVPNNDIRLLLLEPNAFKGSSRKSCLCDTKHIILAWNDSIGGVSYSRLSTYIRHAIANMEPVPQWADGVVRHHAWVTRVMCSWPEAALRSCRVTENTP